MTFQISYIGSDDNTYVNGQDGNNPLQNACKQSGLAQGDVIEYAVLTPRNIVETGLNKLYKIDKTQNQDTHKYYVYGRNGWEVSQDVVAANIPMYHYGWAMDNGTLLADGQTLTSELLEYFTDNNLNLYGRWNSVNLIRVIFYIPYYHTDQPQISLKYESILGNSCYNVSQLTQRPILTENYKKIVDYGNNLSFTDGNGYLREFGSGNGCPSLEQGVQRVTYYGVKNDLTTFTLHPVTGYTNNYIPKYNVSQNTVTYVCYVTEHLVIEVKDIVDVSVGSSEASLVYDSGTNSWSCDVQGTYLEDVDVDVTVFVPLVEKPLVTLNITPAQSGTVAGGGYYMPGDTCNLIPTPSQGFVFDRFESGGLVISSPFTVYNSMTIDAVFTQQQQSAWLTFLYYTSEGYFDLGEGISVTCRYNDGGIHSEVAFYTARSIQIPSGTEVTLIAGKHPYSQAFILSDVNPWREYTGSDPNPVNDYGHPEDAALSTESVSRYKFTMGDTDIKIYAYYTRA